jgi:sugar phosphate isomerase/epimerase
MSKISIGINLYTLRDQCADLSGLRFTFARLKEIGYRYVQVSGVGVEPEIVAEELKASGISCAATHMGWPFLRDETDRAIEIHKMYNCRHTAIGSAPPEYRQGLSGVERLALEMPAVAEKLAEAGISLSYHNHHFDLAGARGRTWLETLYERISPAHLGAELDTYWIQTGGASPAEWIRRMAGREPLLHLKDKIVTIDGEERFAPVGEGNLPWDQILAAAEECGVEFALVEQDQMYGRDPFDAVESSYRFLASKGLL